MKNLILVAALAAAIASAAHAQSPAGDWHGELKAGPASYRQGLSITETSGVLAGTMASPDTGRSGLALSDLKLAGDELSFRVGPSNSFSGRYDAATKSWTGEYATPGGKFPMTYRAGVLPTDPPLPALAGLDGRWEGKIQGVMPIVIRVKTDETGSLAWMDSPSQQTGNLPIPQMTREGTKVSFAMPNLSISFTGELSGDTLAGTFTQGASMPFELKRVSADTSPTIIKPRPQTPKAPFPYKSEEVAIPNPAVAGLTLNCTLTTPDTKGPHPAAFMLTGSGAQDRDETLLGHKPFAVIADHLTRKGIAILRCDDRDYGKPPKPGELFPSLVSDFVTDGKAQLAFLRSRADIDSKRIGVIGHSEGGVTGPRIAADDGNLAFVVMLAGIGVKGRDALVEQRVMLIESMGGDAGIIPAAREAWRSLFDGMLAAGKDDAKAKEAAKAGLTAMSAATVGGGQQLTPQQIDDAAGQFASTYYRDLLAYDPAPVFAKIKAPILAINGTRDVQVAAKQNLDGVKSAAAHNADVTTIELPGLNHLFQTSTTGAITEYADIEETVAPAALTAVADWLVARMKP